MLIIKLLDKKKKTLIITLRMMGTQIDTLFYIESAHLENIRDTRRLEQRGLGLGAKWTCRLFGGLGFGSAAAPGRKASGLLSRTGSPTHPRNFKRRADAQGLKPRSPRPAPPSLRRGGETSR